jgi:tetraacyldisaccharide 4'-kinase
MFLKVFVLYPFTLLYIFVTNFRNFLYDKNYKKSFKFQSNVINVGNLTVGGTGKTPHIEFLIHFLKDKYKIATLSRGYGRKTKGFLWADESSTAQTIGDEPLQFYKKFSEDSSPESNSLQNVSVTVCEERILAVPQILFDKPETQVILLDDAFQHRAIHPNLNILLTDYNRLFYKDFPFPSGRLRESRNGAKRADVVVVSKCPLDLKKEEKQQIKQKISRYVVTQTPIFFTGITYGEIQLVFQNPAFQQPILTKETQVLLVSGIAQTLSLEQYIQKNYTLTKHLRYGDHHFYSVKDLQKIENEFAKMTAPSKIILTTEKDYVKLADKKFEAILSPLPIYYVPIEVYFLEDEEKFKEIVLQVIE